MISHGDRFPDPVSPFADCVHVLVAMQAGRSPDAIAVGMKEDLLTYAQLEELATHISEHLRSMGVFQGDVVGVCLERKPQSIAALLGILKTGASYLPLDPALPADRIHRILEDANPRLVLTAKRFVSSTFLSGMTHCCIEDIAVTPAPASGDVAVVLGDDLAYILYTSGSTGRPKGVEVTHSAFANLLLSMRDKPGCCESDVLLAVTTISFDIAGLELFLPLISGGRVELASASVAADGRLLRKLVEDCRPSILQATPATWRMLIQAGWSGSPGMVALCGGESLPRDLADQLLLRTASLWNMYGPTETTIWSTLAKIETGSDAISIGQPIANTQVYVLDQQLRPQPVGVPGELFIGGKGLARGYHGQAELTAEKFLRDPFSSQPSARLYRTGDLVKLRQDGNLVHLGRLDSQVKIRGFRVELDEIQAALIRHPEIEQAVITAVEEKTGMRQLAAYLVRRPGLSVSGESLRAFLRSSLPEYMVPAHFVFLPAFPLTHNNKIDLRALPAPFPESASSATTVPPRNRLETQVLAIWRQTLEVDNLGIYDNFFDAGGNSLRAIQLLAQVERLTGFQLPLDILFQVPTVAQMTKRMSSENWKPLQRSLVAIRPGGHRLPFFVIPGAGGNVLMFARLARLMGEDQPFYGLQARGVDNYEEPFESVTEMASQYLSEIRMVQPLGPYFIGGTCTGGVVAYEMAQQLLSQGETVALAIMDSSHPSSEAGYLKFTSSFWRLGHFTSRATTYVRELRKLSVTDWLGFLRTKLGNATNGMRSSNNRSHEKTDFQIRAIYRKNMQAVARYSVKEYPGTLLNIVASKRLIGSGIVDTRRCWDSLAMDGGRAEFIAAIDSGQLFVTPHVEVLARLLAEFSEELAK